jgi:hypothetical protein
MTKLDIYRTADVLVKEYGPEQAPLMAASARMRCSISATSRGSADGMPCCGRWRSCQARSKGGRPGHPGSGASLDGQICFVHLPAEETPMADDCIADRTGAVSTADTCCCDVCGERLVATLIQDTTPTNFCAAPLSQLTPNAPAATEPPVGGIRGEKSLVVPITRRQDTKLCAVHLSLVDRDAAGVYAEIARLQAD